MIGPAVRGPLEANPEFKLATGYTYSGHATACAAALANLAIIEREGLVARATQIGERLGAGLQSIAADGLVDHARGVGAMWAIGTHEGQHADHVRARMLEHGVITRAIADHSVTFCPPLITTDQQIDQIIDVLAAATTE